MPSSKLMSMMLAPFSTCWRAIASASSKLPSRTRRANLGEPVTLVRSPTIVKLLSGRMTSASRPLKRELGNGFGTSRGAKFCTASLMAAICVGRGAAAAADNVEPAVLRPFFEIRRHAFGRFGKAGFRKRIGQTGVGINAEINRRDGGQFFDIRPHFFRAQRAVKADAESSGTCEIEAQNASTVWPVMVRPAVVNDGARCHNRHAVPNAGRKLLQWRTTPLSC